MNGETSMRKGGVQGRKEKKKKVREWKIHMKGWRTYSTGGMDVIIVKVSLLLHACVRRDSMWRTDKELRVHK